MNQLERIAETIATYSRHGWQLKRVLLKPETSALVAVEDASRFGDALRVESTLDALWFARGSHAGREAWELRLVAETPYALFETFEAEEGEEDREEVRREMEARLRDYASRAPLTIPHPS